MRKHLRNIVGFAITVGLLWWALRTVSPGEVLYHLKRSDPWIFTASIICATLIFPLRARRWRTILDPVYPRIPFSPLWRSTAVGMALNNLIPARVGEVARAYSLTTVTNVPFPAAVGSLAVDRLFDAIVLLSMGVIGILSPGFPPDVTIAGQSLSHFALLGASFICVLLVAVYSLVYMPVAFTSFFRATVGRLFPKISDRGAEALLNFRDGLIVLRHPGHVISILLWTIAHWLMNTLAFWLGMIAVGIEAPFSAALLMQTIIGLGVAVPASPGFFGVFEKAAILGLSLYSVPVALSTSWAFGYHILSFIPITLIGMYYFVRMDLNLSRIGTASQAASQEV